MEEPQCLPNQKISAVTPENWYAMVKKKLDELQQLMIESEKLATIMSRITATLKPAEAAIVFTNIAANKNFLEAAFKKSNDVTFFEFATSTGLKVLLVYIEGLVDKDLLGRDVVHSFLTKSQGIQANTQLDSETLKGLLSASNVTVTQTMSAVVDDILIGKTVMFIDTADVALLIDCREWEKRNVTEPDVESVIRGPREGFIENIRTNTSLLRRKIKNPNLVFETMHLGRQTRTDVAIAYVNGLVNQAVLSEVRRRLGKIDTDSILETGYIEQFIEDSPFSPIATIANSQKPDIVAAKMLEGRVAILCDGTPHVLTVPHLFIETLQTAEDYYMRPFITFVWRILRISALLVSVLVPGLYVALQTYHQEMIPTILLLRMAGSISDIPFPAGAEMLIMLIFYEFLRESGIRLPRAVGSAISIVGALIVGESAVNAGLVSAPVVIVTAITGVAGFIVPALSEAIVILRFFFLISGTVMGLYGIVCGLIVIVMHAVSLRSFGVPYTTPLAPSDQGILKDFIMRFPLWAMNKRPTGIEKDNPQRQG